ncbi:MAG: glutaredoxin family protein [Candidatus Hodarchaeales archaeon]|jgi:glutaredoxin
MSLDQIKIPDNVVNVEGPRDRHKIFVATLSTCMWCKKGKEWLKENGYAYSYLDVDKIPLEDKNRLKAELHATFGVRPRFPFIVVDKLSVDSGYNPDIWEDMLK